MNAQLVRHAAQTPQPSITESFVSSHKGIPTLVESFPGGAEKVTVGSLNRFQPGARVYPAVDPWDRNRIVEQQWHQFFGDFVRGNVPIREAHGPKPGFSDDLSDITAVGIYPHDWSHQPNRRDGSGRAGYSIAADPLGREGRVHDGDCDAVHPLVSHDRWADRDEEEERALARENRFHEARMIEIQEKRHALARTAVRESRPGWKWCPAHQRWTRAS